MRLIDTSTFSAALRALLDDVIDGHPDAERLRAAMTSGTVALRVTVDQLLESVLISTIDHQAEVHGVATLHMHHDPASWMLAYERLPERDPGTPLN